VIWPYGWKFSEMLVPFDRDENDYMVETKPCG
jgi:hypothetical protein